jgi:hypothetical protein
VVQSGSLIFGPKSKSAHILFFCLSFPKGICFSLLLVPFAAAFGLPFPYKAMHPATAACERHATSVELPLVVGNGGGGKVKADSLPK